MKCAKDRHAPYNPFNGNSNMVTHTLSLQRTHTRTHSFKFTAIRSGLMAWHWWHVPLERWQTTTTQQQQQHVDVRAIINWCWTADQKTMHAHTHHAHCICTSDNPRRYNTKPRWKRKKRKRERARTSKRVRESNESGNNTWGISQSIIAREREMREWNNKWERERE